MLRFKLFTTLVFILSARTISFACSCEGNPEQYREILDLTQTAEQEERYVVLVEIIGEETLITELPNSTYIDTALFYRGKIIEILGGCIDYESILIRAGGVCSDYDSWGIKIGDIGLALGFQSKEDKLSTSQCTTKNSYYDVTNGIANTGNEFFPGTNIEDLRHQESCGLSYEIYPNPASSFMQIFLDKEPINEAIPVRILDARGRLVLENRGSKIPIQHLASGTYYVSIGSRNRVTPFVICH